MPIDDILAEDANTTYSGQGQPAQEPQEQSGSDGMSTQVTIDLGNLSRDDVELLLAVFQTGLLVYIAWKL